MKSPNLNIEYICIDQLHPYTNNARTHSPRQVKQIARSIKSFGFINPILVGADNVLVAGHGRLLAAKQLGLSQVPAVRVEHLSEDEKRAYMLADNKIAENAGWDPDLLRVELSFLSTLEIDFDVELTGFETPEIDFILASESPGSPEPAPPEPPPAEEAITRQGDVWLLGPHRLLCGDCRDTRSMDTLLGQTLARMVFTDPPYNVPIDGHVCGLGKAKHANFAMACGELSSDAFAQFLTDSLGQLARHCVNGAVQYIFMDWRHMRELLAAGRDVYGSLVNLCVWAKTNGGMGSFYRSQHELVFVFKHGEASHINNVELGKHGRYRTTVWTYPGVNAFGAGRNESLAMHPTVKPVQLIADAILDASKRGETVLDGFTGSGSTLIAAEQVGRVFCGIEIDPRYVDVTLKRWTEVSGVEPVLDATGETFAQLTERVSSERED